MHRDRPLLHAQMCWSLFVAEWTVTDDLRNIKCVDQYRSIIMLTCFGHIFTYLMACEPNVLLPSCVDLCLGIFNIIENAALIYTQWIEDLYKSFDSQPTSISPSYMFSCFLFWWNDFEDSEKKLFHHLHISVFRSRTTFLLIEKVARDLNILLWSEWEPF